MNSYFVGSKAKKRILKRVFQDVCVSGGKKFSFFGKFGVLFFSRNTRFEIRPFALLPTIYKYF